MTGASNRNSFPKSGRLFLKKDIEQLFAMGKSFISYPLQVIYLPIKDGSSSFGISILISVPKKRIKHAVGRNRIKRLVRENYRLKKDMVTPCLQEQKLHIAFVYICNNLLSYSDVEKAMDKALTTIKGQVWPNVF